jgi:PAS domain S-box-containing protein
MRLLRGEAPAGIQNILLKAAPPAYDWRQLQRWGISEARLPPGSTVQFRQPSFWQQYAWAIIFVLAVCVLEALLIDVLLRERRRRRLAQQSLEERLRFEKLVSELSGTFINLPPDKVESRIVEALGQVATLLRFDIAALSLFTGRGTEGRVAFIWRAEGVPEIPPGLTDEDFPWMAQELLAGRDVGIRDLEMLPLAARTDRVTYEKYHVRSVYNVRMIAGGEVIGVSSLCTAWEKRDMSQELLQGQRLLGEIFANALARKKAQESLQESEQNFRRLVETTAAVPWQADVENWVFTYVGPQAEKLLGYPLEQWYQKDFWVSHLHPDDRETAVNTCLTNSHSADDFEFEYRMISASGQNVWVHDIVRCEHQNGSPAQLRGLMLDITERKQADESLRESEQRMRLAASAANLGLWTWDVARDEVWLTPEGLKFFGWNESDKINLEQFIEALHPDDRERTRQKINRSLERGDEYSAEYRVQFRDRVMRWIAARGEIEFGANRKPRRMLGVAIDITQRKRAEEALRESEQHFRTMAETAADVIITMDQNSTILFVNAAVERVFGYVPTELIGQKITALMPEGLRQYHLEGMRHYLETGERRVSWSAVSFPGLHKSGREISLEIAFAESRISDRRVFTGIMRDITERKRTELEAAQLRAELAHISRVSTMGELAASLAHELNQPLTAILSNAQAAQRFMAANPDDLEDVREILKDIVQDNNRAGEVIRRMRALVRKEELAFVSLDLASVIGDVAALIHSDAILHSVQILVELNPGLPQVRGDRVQLQQVVLNLLLNAFDAMKDCPTNHRQVMLRGNLDDARMVRVAVQDCGVGLSRDKLEKIFEPFYSTKRDGMGMGLSISRSIIEAHGGRLWAANNPDRGATFYFTLPIASTGDDRIAAASGA